MASPSSEKVSIAVDCAAEVDLVVTDMGVFEIKDGKMIIVEKNPEFTIEEIQGLQKQNWWFHHSSEIWM